MPFRSEAQRRYLWENHPEIAKRWAEEYPEQGDLPKRKYPKKSRTRQLLDAKQKKRR